MVRRCLAGLPDRRPFSAHQKSFAGVGREVAERQTAAGNERRELARIDALLHRCPRRWAAGKPLDIARFTEHLFIIRVNVQKRLRVRNNASRNVRNRTTPPPLFRK